MIKLPNYPKLLNHIKTRQLAKLIRHFTSHPKPHCNFHFSQTKHPLLQSMLSAIKSCYSIHNCRKIHGRVIKTLSYRDGFIGDCLVSLYFNLGCFDDAHKLFEEIPDRDLVSWNSWISQLSRSGGFGKSLEMFNRMRLEMGMEPNEVTLLSLVSACTDTGGFDEGAFVHGLAFKMGLLSEVKVVHSFINMYGMFGYVGLACRLFETMVVQNLVSWNSMIKIYAKNGFGEEGFKFVKAMRRAGIDPDQATVVTLLQGCKDVCVGNLVEALHGYIITAGLVEDVTIMTTLMSVYTKSGRLDASQEVFRAMKEPDTIAWTAVLAGYALHGYGREAIELFDFMVSKGEKPDHVTFTHLLSACSHSGLVEEGKSYFEIMSRVYSLEPRLDHYSCMVDLLGRSGHLREAHLLIRSMPMEPTAGVWGSLLNACKIYSNIELGKEVAERLFVLNPTDSRNYIMLSSMYSEAGQWPEGQQTRILMKEKRVVESAGCSSI
ncbi:hypothetical protein DCAR_0519145 [Daucus carota subsp. sativus]|uniref:Pentacotripeptide-repeat region of PRORP domain-containing protein n=2 Tax=Daucus carota subsp. sativus TaxID=79200 RepID=A0AAF0X1Q7_DAUCS|nr:hypothetical protein DCAR_0519145 [Daucus carota subsp. sativus]